MFEDLIRELEKTDGRRVSVAMPTDSDGYFDKACPSEECLFEFKIHEEDWRDKDRDEKVFCPLCRHSAEADEWWTEEQLEHTKRVALGEIEGDIDAALRRGADRWNRQQSSNSFISITMHFDRKPARVILPLAAVEPMQLKISCPGCNCRYAVIGAAYFCPSCGHNSVERDFARSLQTLTASLDAVPLIRSAIADVDVAENTVRFLIESSLQNAVTAFQRYTEALYVKHPTARTPRRNAFQNLSEGSVLWQKAFSTDYEFHIGKADIEKLNLYFQQRHLLAHRDGIVDADYISRSGDGTYDLGQRIVVKGESVSACVDLISRLAAGLKSDSTLHD